MKYRIIIAKPSDSLLKSRYRLVQEDIDLCKQVNNGDFLEWVCRNYANGSIELPEQLEEVKGVLDTFEKIRNKKNFTGSRDINSYSYRDLLALQNLEVPEGNQKKKLLQETLTYTWKDWSLYVPRNIDEFIKLSGGSSVDHLGKVYPKTSWCTVNLESAKDYFSLENNLIIRKEGRNYAQIDMANHEIKDSRDNDLLVRRTLIDLNLGEFLKKVPYKYWFKMKPLDLGKLQDLDSASLISLFRYHASPEENLERILKNRIRTLQGIPPVNDLLSYEEYCLKGESWEEARKLLLEVRNSLGLSHYSIYKLRSRWEEAEPIIFMDPEATVDYCSAFRFRAPAEAEALIVPHFYEAINYLKEVIRGPWPEFEKTLSGNALKDYQHKLKILT